MNRLSLTACLLIGLTSCGVADHASNSVPEHDSVFQQQNIPKWELHATPDVQIGGKRTDAGHDLSGVAGAGFVGHEVIIADRGSARVLWFDSSGTLIHRAGGRGQGPGEFQLLAGLFVLPSGEIVAYDERLVRATRFDSTGLLTGTHTLDLSPMRSFQPVPIGVLANSIIFRDLIPEMDRRNQPAGVFADSAFIVSVPLPGPSHRIVSLHGRDALLLHDDGGRSAVPVLFGDERLVATTLTGLVILDTATGEIQLLSSSGELERQTVLQAPTLALRNEWVEAAKDSLIAAVEKRWEPFAARIGAETVARAIAVEQKTIEATPVAGSMPGFSQLLADECGRIWIGEGIPPEAQSRKWVILDNQLEPQALIETGAEIQVMAISCDRIAILDRDGLDVEEISIFRILR